MARVPAVERRRMLIEAAFTVMARVGVPAATTRLICTEAGVPQSVFHYCFGSKDELFRELTTTVVTDMLGSALDSLVEGESFQDSLRDSLQRMAESALERPDRQLALYELTTTMLRDPTTAPLARWQYEQYFDHTAQLLLAVAERAEMAWTAPIEVLGRFATTVIDGAVLGWLTDRDTAQVTQMIDRLATQLATSAAAASP